MTEQHLIITVHPKNNFAKILAVYTHSFMGKLDGKEFSSVLSKVMDANEYTEHDFKVTVSNQILSFGLNPERI